MSHLVGELKLESHNFCSFRTGLALGLAVPAMLSGVAQSLRQETRDAIRGWDALLYIYAAFFVPVFFSLMIGFNLLAWSKAGIDYACIFGLKNRTRLDHRQYFEIPTTLLATLCYAFWFSFSRIGAPHVTPTTWPLLWLAFASALLINPLPITHPHSRRWFLKRFGKLLISGTHQVEFVDFWLGDQLCSLACLFASLYPIGCIYVHDFKENWRYTCGLSQNWGPPFILAAIPLLIRLVQSLRRYHDSRLVSHLLNVNKGGKYGSGVISYLLYFNWRHRGSHREISFAFWIVSSVVYSIYACSWDFLMDWSVLKVHSVYPFLRNELGYPGYVPAYYFAIITNLLLRFSWTILIPIAGPPALTRGFILGMLEIFRRWQWNFFRLENEHIGNMDQYLISKEIPSLPYSTNESRNDGKEDEDPDEMQSDSGVDLESGCCESKAA